MLGSEQTKIELFNNSDVLQNSHTLQYTDMEGLVQVKFDKIYDTDNPIVLESGDVKYPIKGHKVRIIIPIKQVENCTSTGWESFLVSLCEWEQKIRVTPNTDASTQKYWVRLTHDWNFERYVKYLGYRGSLEFKGTETIAGVD